MTFYILQSYDSLENSIIANLAVSTDINEAEKNLHTLNFIRAELAEAYKITMQEPTDPRTFEIYKRAADEDLSDEESLILEKFFQQNHDKAQEVFAKYGLNVDEHSSINFHFRIQEVENSQFNPTDFRNLKMAFPTS